MQQYLSEAPSQSTGSDTIPSAAFGPSSSPLGRTSPPQPSGSALQAYHCLRTPTRFSGREVQSTMPSSARLNTASDCNPTNRWISLPLRKMIKVGMFRMP